MFKQNISLRPYNTFGIEAYASNFAEVNDVDLLKKIVSKHPDVFVLSGGSNILLTRNLEKPVIHLNLKGREIIKTEDSNKVLVKAQAGENWHEFVTWSIDQGLGGLENLSLIPGNVGTSPMQNIGAYGVEIKDIFHELEALEIQSGKVLKFSTNQCKFGYRESVFKNEYKGKFIILNVTFRLKSSDYKLVTDYGAIRSELENRKITNPGIKDVSDAVIAIRQSKLPDPKVLGNSGSFFKNPVVSSLKFDELLSKNPEMPFYKIDATSIKIPAGWLVETCGFKGKRFGDAGVHAKQALVLVNHGQAKGIEILELAQKIQKKVALQFGIELEMEVNVI